MNKIKCWFGCHEIWFWNGERCKHCYLDLKKETEYRRLSGFETFSITFILIAILLIALFL